MAFERGDVVRVEVSIETTNDAFQPDPADEVSRLLAEAAEAVEEYGLRSWIVLKDVNGKRVGEVRPIEEKAHV